MPQESNRLPVARGIFMAHRFIQTVDCGTHECWAHVHINVSSGMTVLCPSAVQTVLDRRQMKA